MGGRTGLKGAGHTLHPTSLDPAQAEPMEKAVDSMTQPTQAEFQHVAPACSLHTRHLLPPWILGRAAVSMEA